MSDVTADVLESAAGRWRRIDPLLPDPAPAHVGCGASLIVPAAPGRAAAAGWCRHREVAPGDEAGLAWGAAAQFWLAARVAGDPGEPGTGAALDELLAAWRGHLASEPAAADQDSQAAAGCARCCAMAFSRSPSSRPGSPHEPWRTCLLPQI